MRILFSIVLIFIFFLQAVQPASAAPTPQTTGGLLVNGAILDLSVTPGMVYTHHMSIGVGAQAPAMDVTVEAMGFGQTTDGTYQAIPANEDQNPYTAISYISAISNPVFHLNPGENAAVDVTITVPTDPGIDTRYAAIYVKGTPANSGNVTQVLAVFVPVILTPAGARLNKSGTITDLKVDPVEPGKPIVVTTMVKNIGNRHFKVRGEVKISDPSGQVVADLPLPLTGNSIVPPFSRVLTASYSALDKAAGLQAGTYTAEAQIIMEDGAVLGSQKTQFEISQAYRPFPEIDEQHIQITCFKDEEPSTIDARQKTDVMVSFAGVGKVNGCVAIGKFAQEPAGSPRFGDVLDSGGIGASAIKYFGIQTQGFSTGAAQISVKYSSNELNGISPNSLFLAFRDGQAWGKMDNQAVQTGAGLVVADLQTASLINGPVLALGTGDENPSPAASILDNPFLVGGIAGGVILILVLVVVIWRMAARNRRNQNQAITGR
jgi:hypothetical protein